MRLKSNEWSRIMLISMVLAAWPVWRWYFLRMTDGSDEPCGLLALATFVFLALRDRATLRLDERRFVRPLLLLGVYVATFRFFSPLPRAMLVMAAFALLSLGKRELVARGGLLALSLPVVASAQFYVGYPLRLLAAEGSAIILRALQFGVVREGLLLNWRGEAILVDAPCSGVQMLWCGFFVAATVASQCRLGNGRSALLFAIALLVVVSANVIRVTALFFKGTQIIALPEWTHEAIGAALFALAAYFIVSLGQREMKSCPA